MSAKALSQRLLALGALALSSSLLLGCAVDEKVSPVPLAVTADAGPDAPEPLPLDAGPWKRSILTRNPVGGPSGNLLVDGDFEHSTVGSPGPQTGWRAFSADGSGAVEIKTETGGLCRTGLRCAVVEPKTLQLLRGTAARDAGIVTSIWAKLPPGSPLCKVVSVILIRIDDFSAHTKLSSDKVPDEEGNCQYSARISEKTDAVALYVENTLSDGTTALLDSAIIGPDDGTIHPKAAEIWVTPPDVAARLQTVRETLLRTAPPPRKAPVSFKP